MKTFRSRTSLSGMAARLLVALSLCVLCPSVSFAAPGVGTNEDFSAISQSIIKLLQSHDAARFAAEVAPTAGDYQSALGPNTPSENAEFMTNYQKTSEFQRQKVEQTAQALLAKADSLHLVFSNSDLHAWAVPPEHFGTASNAGLVRRAWTEKVEIHLTSQAGATNRASGEFQLSVHGLLKFASGWRAYDGIQWTAFPTNIVDAKTVRELALLGKAAENQGINDQEDPALRQLGESLVHFIREGDPTIFMNDAFVTTDLIWSLYQQSGRPGPSRKELEDHMKEEGQQQLALAHTAVQLLSDAGIDLKNADIQIVDATLEHVQSTGSAGSLLGLMGQQYKLKLAVKTAAKAKNGASLSGQYVLAARSLIRFADAWRVMDNVHWDQVPDGVLDAPTAAKLAYENYAVEHGTLPPHSTVPEIEFTTLDGSKKMKLSDLRGKVVVLDFWATWCGPCQDPMAKLQTLRQSHPDWQDKVAIVPLSIDDTMDVVVKHVDHRGWTNTFNVWAGEGGWHSPAPTAFRVKGVPTTYIIDGQGQIIRAGHPAGMDIGQEVDTLLTSAKP